MENSFYSKLRHKRITAIPELGANYIFHLMAVAKIGFDSEYAQKYVDSISKNDKNYLKKWENLLIFETGTEGSLTAILIVLPAYINLDSENKLKSYFDLLNAGLSTKNTLDFQKKFAKYLKKLTKDWIYPKNFGQYLNTLSKHKDIIRSIGDIYARNFNFYIKNIWPSEKSQMDKIAKKIISYFKKRDIIEKWETLLQIKFKYEEYQILLCSAIKNGPNAISVGYERNIFYSGTEIKHTLHFISHEVGTHLLSDDLNKIYAEENHDNKNLSYAYECLAMFYNKLVLNKKNLAYELKSFDDKTRLPIYKDIYTQNPDIRPHDLLLHGIKKHLNNK